MKPFVRIALLGATGGPLILILAGLLRNHLAADTFFRRGMDVVFSAVNAPIQPLLINMNDHEMALAIFTLCTWWMLLGLCISVGSAFLVQILKKNRGDYTIH